MDYPESNHPEAESYLRRLVAAQTGDLFIGGPLDGQRRVVKPDHSYVKAPIHCGHELETTTYRRMQIEGVTVWVCESLSPHDAIRALVRRYPVPLEP